MQGSGKKNTDARGGRVGAGQCHDDNTKTGDHETGLRWAQKQRRWAQKQTSGFE